MVALFLSVFLVLDLIGKITEILKIYYRFIRGYVLYILKLYIGYFFLLM